MRRHVGDGFVANNENMKCPNCNTEIKLDEQEKSEVFKLLTQDKEFMKKLGQEAAKAYLGIEK